MTTHTLEPITTRDGRVPTGKSKAGRAVRSNEDAANYFADSLLEREPRDHLIANSIIVEKDRIYSYGRHFCIARIVRRESGVPKLLLMNADSDTRGSRNAAGSTADHQGLVRSAVRRYVEALDITKLEIPFSALEGAGIELDSIRPLEIRPSRTTHHDMSSTTAPGPFRQLYGEDHKPTGEVDPTQANVERAGMAHAYCEGYAQLQSDGTWTWQVRRHWMGESIFRGKSTELRRRMLTPEERVIHTEWMKYLEAAGERSTAHRESWVAGVGYDESIANEVERLRDECAELQSQLPSSVKVHSDEVTYSVTRWATYLSSYDYAERHRPYFLCELPYGCGAETVDDGIAALMPEQVSLHIGLGDNVLRQGDVYGIPTKFTTAELESIAAPTTVTRWEARTEPPYSIPHKHQVTIRRRYASTQGHEGYEPGALDILGTNHQATHVIKTVDGRWFGRGRMVHAPNGRDPDHAVVKLEEGVWYEFVKNTVPLSSARSTTRVGMGSSLFQSHQARAWTVGGGVD